MSGINAVSRNLWFPAWIGVKTAPGWRLDCHGAEAISKLKNPFDYCLRAKRSSLNDKRFYLLGDSHAAQFFFMAKKSLENTSFKLAFINTEQTNDFPHSFWGVSDNQKALSSLTIRNLLQDSRPGDIVAFAFHRGYLNKERDEHISKKDIAIKNKKIKYAESNFYELSKILLSRNTKVLLIRDMPMLSTPRIKPEICDLQQKLFARNGCDISIKQDRLTRKTQDSLIDNLTHRLLKKVIRLKPGIQASMPPHKAIIIPTRIKMVITYL